MDLVGAWLRQLLRAGTVATLVPIAIAASLAVVLAGTSGISGLDSLGQLVTGPEISPVQRANAETPSERGESVRDIALVAPPTLLADTTQAAPPALGAGSAPPATGQTVRPPARVVPLRPPVVRPPPAPVTPPPAAAAPPPAAPPTPGQRSGRVVEELGETVDEVVGVVGEVIGGLGETLGGILDGPPPRR